MDEQEALRALAAVQATRRQMRERAQWSFARHAAFGLVMGGLVASYVLPRGWPVLGVAMCLVATLAIVARDRRRDGFFVNGYRAGRTQILALGLCLVALAGLVLAVVLRTRFGLFWAPLPIGFGVAMLCTIGSIGWERLYRDELAGDGNGD